MEAKVVVQKNFCFFICSAGPKKIERKQERASTWKRVCSNKRPDGTLVQINLMMPNLLRLNAVRKSAACWTGHLDGLLLAAKAINQPVGSGSAPDALFSK